MDTSNVFKSSLSNAIIIFIVTIFTLHFSELLPIYIIFDDYKYIICLTIYFISVFSINYRHKSIKFAMQDIEAYKHDVEYTLNYEYSKLNEQIQEFDEFKTDINKYYEEKESIINDQVQSSPYLAKLISDFEFLKDRQKSYYLKTKKRPALKAAEQVSVIAQEKRTLKYQVKVLEYQLNFYESLFPWLEDFKEITVDEALNSVSYHENIDSDEYSKVRTWLSKEEYCTLSESEKWELALKRYLYKPKSKWEVGLMYERFVGYWYEQQGYNVKFQGAIKGLEDMGCDLICSSGNAKFIVQCKYWNSEKIIREKHILQLLGTVAVFNFELSPDESQYQGVFVTSTSLSDVAKYCAKNLGITVIDNFPLKEHPMIKCHISNSGEKIYHLPFDQQYDKIQMNKGNRAFYANTVAEAESQGFRHAFKWSGTK